MPIAKVIPADEARTIATPAGSNPEDERISVNSYMSGQSTSVLDSRILMKAELYFTAFLSISDMVMDLIMCK